MSRYFFILFLLVLDASLLSAQTSHTLLRKGDAEYDAKNYAKSEEEYRKSLELNKTDKGAYNLGNSIFMQQRYDDAIKQYEQGSLNAKSQELKNACFYNKGNAHFLKKEYDKAVEAYKSALRLNPNDLDAKKNLALAKKELQKQQEQKNKDQNKDKDKEKDKEKKDSDKNKEEDKKDQNDPNKDSKNQPEQKQANSPQEIKKEEAKKMLQIMDQEDKKVMQRVRKGDVKPSKSGKDW
jgi:Ca-activated chloride channel homolog